MTRSGSTFYVCKLRQESQGGERQAKRARRAVGEESQANGVAKGAEGERCEPETGTQCP